MIGHDPELDLFEYNGYLEKVKPEYIATPGQVDIHSDSFQNAQDKTFLGISYNQAAFNKMSTQLKIKKEVPVFSNAEFPALRADWDSNMSFFNGACQPTDDHINEISEHTIGDADGELPDLLDATGAGHHNEDKLTDGLKVEWIPRGDTTIEQFVEDYSNQRDATEHARQYAAPTNSGYDCQRNFDETFSLNLHENAEVSNIPEDTANCENRPLSMIIEQAYIQSISDTPMVKPKKDAQEKNTGYCKKSDRFKNMSTEDIMKRKVMAHALKQFGFIPLPVGDRRQAATNEAKNVYFCVICEVFFKTKLFTKEQALQRHYQNHVGMEYSCDQCDLKTNRKDYLKQHVKDYHKKSQRTST